MLTFAANECGMQGVFQGPQQYRYRDVLNELREIIHGV